MPLSVGTVVEGTVTGITNFGAFVELPSGETGLVHISEVADVYVTDIHEFVKRADKVKVKILSVDPSGKKIGLSIRQAQEGASPTRRMPSGPRPSGGGRGRPTPGSFEDKLKRFMKDSEDRLGDLRRNTDSKRGGRGSKSF
jgi:S1 RNA binding domain protein